MRMEVTFPGGVEVAARFRDHRVLTDQTEKGGGRDAAPAPFDLFLASIATCAGFYALRFCQMRSIDTAELGLTLETVRDADTKRLATVRLALRLPAAFPPKYEKAIVRAIDQCAVKRAILDPPELETTVEYGSPS